MKEENKKVEPHPITCKHIAQAGTGIENIRFEIRSPDIVEQLRKENETLRSRVKELEEKLKSIQANHKLWKEGALKDGAFSYHIDSNTK